MNPLLLLNPEVLVKNIYEDEIDVKRFCIPGCVVAGMCPQCRQETELDLGYTYLSFPITNKFFFKNFVCHKCGQELVVNIKLTVSVEVSDLGCKL